MITNDEDQWAEVDYVYPPDEWLHFFFQHDADSKVFSLFINDEQIIRNYGMVFGRPINHLRFLCFTDQPMDDAFLDDINVRNRLDEEENAGPVRHAPQKPLIIRDNRALSLEARMR